jgi:hypothetical protein
MEDVTEVGVTALMLAIAVRFDGCCAALRPWLDNLTTTHAR